MKTLKKISAIFIYILLTRFALAAAPDIALLIKANGDVKIRRATDKEWIDAKKGDRLHSGDIIKTGSDAFAAFMFTDDKSLVKVRDNTTLAIKGKREKSSILKRLKFAFGKIWVKVQRQKSRFYIETPSGVAAVKGTEFYCLLNQDGRFIVICTDGLVSLINKFGNILLNAGQTGETSKNKPPVVYKTPEGERPEWGSDGKSDGYLEFEFQDENGNVRTLKLKYNNSR